MAKENKSKEKKEELIILSKYKKANFIIGAEEMGYTTMIVSAAFNEYSDEEEFTKDEGIKIIENFKKKPIK